MAKSCVETVRLMRHEGIRVIVSTQSPLTMPPELLELSTTTVLHRFHSEDWWKYLSSKIPLPADGFQRVRSLDAGEALVFAQGAHLILAKHAVQECWDEDSENGKVTNSDFFECRIRQRITKDRGRSRKNKLKKKKDTKEQGSVGSTL